MDVLLYEEAFGCYHCWHYVPHVHEWAILPKFHVGDHVEVCKEGCQVCSLHVKDHDEPP